MIDRERVLKGLYTHGYRDCKSCPYWGAGENGRSSCTQLAREALTLLKEQEPKTGRWIFYFDDKSGRDGYKCSECGSAQPWYYDYFEHFEFCPYCGVKMEGQ